MCLCVGKQVNPQFGRPQIVTASSLSDNKIDIHVSVTINTTNGSLSPAVLPLPLPLPAALNPLNPLNALHPLHPLNPLAHQPLNPVPSLSGVSCTLADLKKQRSQSRVLVASPSALVANSQPACFLFPVHTEEAKSGGGGGGGDNNIVTVNEPPSTYLPSFTNSAPAAAPSHAPPSMAKDINSSNVKGMGYVSLALFSE